MISLVTLVASCVHQLTSDETVWGRSGYGAHYTTVERLSATIDKALLPDETLYVWDYQPGFYVLPQRRPPAGVFYNTHAMKGPLVEELTGRVMRMLQTAPPEVIIIHEDEFAKMNDAGAKLHPVSEWIRSHARPLALPDAPPFIVYVRTGGPLAKRIADGQVKWIWLQSGPDAGVKGDAAP